MTDDPKPREEFTYHRPISIFVTGIRPMPDVGDLPRATRMTINLKLTIPMQDALLDYLQAHRDKEYREPVLSIEIVGPTP